MFDTCFHLIIFTVALAAPAEEKIRIVLDGLRGETSIAELCRREGIAERNNMLLEAQIARFVEHYNHRHYHESLQNLTPADVYFGRGQTILLERERIKRGTIRQRRLKHQLKAA